MGRPLWVSLRGVNKKKKALRKLIPSFIRPVIRVFYYKQERARIFRELKIRDKQDELIKNYDPDTQKLIVFMVQGADRENGRDKISGGAISIVSLCEESGLINNIHDAPVIMCTLPNQYLMLKHTQFNNNTHVYRFSQLSRYFRELEQIIIHIPEYLCSYFMDNLKTKDKKWLASISHVHINVMNQNVKVMPEVAIVQKLKTIASKVTSTTAHQQYCTQYYRSYYDIPIHKFSVWISPEKYLFTPYKGKENLMVVSPDLHPLKEKVLTKLKEEKDLRIQIIQNLTYEEYKKTISKAKWAVTFGEGLDGYFIEPVFSGAIGFAVYNEDFFTDDFKELETVYSSYEELLSNIANSIEQFDCEQKFNAYQQKQFSVCARHYSHEEYRRNIAEFYKGNYTFQ